MSSFTLWIRLKDNSAIDRCITNIGELYNSDKPYKEFPAHITLVPSISSKHPNMEEDEIIMIVEKSVKHAREELGNDYSLNLRFRDVMSQQNTWSQCVYLEVDDESLTLQELNLSLMSCFDMKPGFQAPCKKPHLSLIYGELSEESKEQARKLVKKDFEQDILKSTFEMSTVELWKTGGGLDGITQWKHVADFNL